MRSKLNAIRIWHGGRITIVWASALLVVVGLAAWGKVVAEARYRLQTNVLRHSAGNPFLSHADSMFRETLYEHAGVEDAKLWSAGYAESLHSTGKSFPADLMRKRQEVWKRLEARSFLLRIALITLIVAAILVFPTLPLVTTWIWLGRARTFGTDAPET